MFDKIHETPEFTHMRAKVTKAHERELMESKEDPIKDKVFKLFAIAQHIVDEELKYDSLYRAQMDRAIQEFLYWGFKAVDADKLHEEYLKKQN